MMTNEYNTESFGGNLVAKKISKKERAEKCKIIPCYFFSNLFSSMFQSYTP